MNKRGIITVDEFTKIEKQLNKIDLHNGNKYDLLNLYESVMIGEEDEKILSEMLESNEEAKKIHDFLCGTLNEDFDGTLSESVSIDKNRNGFRYIPASPAYPNSTDAIARNKYYEDREYDSLDTAIQHAVLLKYPNIKIVSHNNGERIYEEVITIEEAEKIANVKVSDIRTFKSIKDARTFLGEHPNEGYMWSPYTDFGPMAFKYEKDFGESLSESFGKKDIEYLKANKGEILKKGKYSVKYDEYIDANTNEPTGGEFTLFTKAGRYGKDRTAFKDEKQLIDYINRHFEFYEDLSESVRPAIDEIISQFKSSVSDGLFDEKTIGSMVDDMKKAKSSYDAFDIGNIYTNLNFFRFKDNDEIVRSLKRMGDKDVYFDRELAKPYIEKHQKNESISEAQERQAKIEVRKVYSWYDVYVDNVLLLKKLSEEDAKEIMKTMDDNHYPYIYRETEESRWYDEKKKKVDARSDFFDYKGVKIFPGDKEAMVVFPKGRIETVPVDPADEDGGWEKAKEFVDSIIGESLSEDTVKQETERTIAYLKDVCKMTKKEVADETIYSLYDEDGKFIMSSPNYRKIYREYKERTIPYAPESAHIEDDTFGGLFEDTIKGNFSDLRKALKRFNENGKYAKQGDWKIVKGGYDLAFEIYYRETPILCGKYPRWEMTPGTELELYNDYDMTKKAAETVCSVYNDCYVPVTEDTVKQGSQWVNKGKEGTHGKFKTKKEADAQRKAMFSRGFKESIEDDEKTMSLTDFINSRDFHTVLTDEAEGFDIRQWQKDIADDLGDDFSDYDESLNEDAPYKRKKITISEDDVQALLDKIATSDVYIANYYKTKGFKKAHSLTDEDIKEIDRKLDKGDYSYSTPSDTFKLGDTITVFITDKDFVVNGKDISGCVLHIEIDVDYGDAVAIVSMHETNDRGKKIVQKNPYKKTESVEDEEEESCFDYKGHKICQSGYGYEVTFDNGEQIQFADDREAMEYIDSLNEGIEDTDKKTDPKTLPDDYVLLNSNVTNYTDEEIDLYYDCIREFCNIDEIDYDDLEVTFITNQRDADDWDEETYTASWKYHPDDYRAEEYANDYLEKKYPKIITVGDIKKSADDVHEYVKSMFWEDAQEEAQDKLSPADFELY